MPCAEYDPDTGLVRFGHRDYDPDTGRFTALDPLGDAGGDADWYGYCLDDPVNYVDPEGLEMIGSQVRKGDKSTLYLHDVDTGDDFIYDFREPAPKLSPTTGEAYGDGAKLPPNDYEIRLRKDDGSLLKKGDPVYTTPGQPIGTVISPNGKVRTWIAPHKGTRSEGCPLQQTQQERDSLRMLLQYQNGRGGTRVRVREE